MKAMIILLALAISFTSYSNDEVNQSEDSFEEFEDVSDNSSEQNRMNKKFSLTGGIGFNSIVGVQTLSAGFFLDKNSILELSFSHGKDDGVASRTYYDIDEDTYVSEVVGVSELTTVSLAYKKFVGNSFYIRPAFEYHDSQDDFASAFLLRFKTDSEILRGYGASFSIGNQWQFQNFTIGCDWVGYKSIFIEEESVNDPSTSYLSLLNFYVGMSF